MSKTRKQLRDAEYYSENRGKYQKQQADYYRAHKDSKALSIRSSQLKAKYGMSIEEYDVLLRAQNGRCKICRTGDVRMLSVDHCHDTGTIRGLLCLKCNSGLGMFNDDPALLRKATQYLVDFL